MMTECKYWAVIPAAGSGVRMASALPKQYLPLAGKTVLEWAITPFLLDIRCQMVVVVISPDDQHWAQLALAHSKLQFTHGGAERVHSVLAGLQSLTHAETNDWVMVHDAARPCVSGEDLDKLLAAAVNHDVGGILATPLADTLKQANSGGCIENTVPRDYLWRALTPQLFKIGMLKNALQSALAKGLMVTDESSALEAMGYHPKLVEGRSDNLKITVPSDLHVAASILAARNSCS